MPTNTATLPEGIDIAAPVPPPKRAYSVGPGMVALPPYNTGGKKPLLFLSGATDIKDLLPHASPFAREIPMADVSRQARHLTTFAGGVFERTLLHAGIFEEKWGYGTCIPYPVKKPKRVDYMWGADQLRWLIESVEPEVVVCLGKAPFDELCQGRFNQREVMGGFWKPKWGDFLLYCTDSLAVLGNNPEKLDRFRVDILTVLNFIEPRSHKVTLKQNITVVNDMQGLTRMLDGFASNKVRLLSVDCEWGRDPEKPHYPITYLDGGLRSLQIAPDKENAFFLRFRDAEENYAFGGGNYKEAGEVLRRFCDRPLVRYIGHNIAADLVWMHHVLGMEYRGKVFWDTLFAEQTLDESADQKLERLAMRYTDLGRYDQDLIIWKKRHKEINATTGEDVGYGRIPDEILVRYACLRHDSKVQLEDGSWENIGKIVNARKPVKVRALLNGKVVTRRVTNWYRANVNHKKWFRLRFFSSRSNPKCGLLGPSFTPDHKVLTLRGKVVVEDLIIGEDRVITDEYRLTKDQRSVLLGSLLGDGGLNRRNEAGVSFVFSQCHRRGDYARFKRDILLPTFPGIVQVNTEVNVSFFTPHYRQLAEINDIYPFLEGTRKHKIKPTPELLKEIGPLGWAVWYQDDGVFTRNKSCRIICYTSDEEAIATVCEFFGPGVSYSQGQHAFMFSVEASKRFLEAVSPYMHSCFAYKTNREDILGSKLEELETTPTELYAELVVARELRPISRCDKPYKNARYCLEVEEAGNFLTQVGFVSNCRDVLAPMRAYPIQHKYMKAEGTLEYYLKYRLPFVTDGFVDMALAGLPMHMGFLDELRDLLQHTEERLLDQFRQELESDAYRTVLLHLAKLVDKRYFSQLHQQIVAMATTKTPHESFLELCRWVQERLAPSHVLDIPPLQSVVQHFRHCRYKKFGPGEGFNIRSGPQMINWLYGVKGLTPIKTTKKDGIQMAWEKIASFPEELQASFSPSVDRSCIEVFARENPKLATVLEINLVGNQIKNFLRPPDENGVERGVHKWVCSDGKIHSNFMLTESGRPRSFNPNILNFSKNVAKPIEAAVQRFNPGREAFSLRSCIGYDEFSPWCLVDTDLMTAELVALAVISGDMEMLESCVGPDTQFALKDNPDGGDPIPCRIRFNTNTTRSVQEFNDTYAHLLCPEDDTAYLRNPDGSLVHPRRDQHWELAEEFMQKPREVLSKKIHRDALAKPANFSCIAKDQLVTTDHGLIPIQAVQLHHKVWDGVAFVTHDGVIYQGEKEVISYAGLTATPDHKVWLESGRTCTFVEAASNGANIMQSLPHRVVGKLPEPVLTGSTTRVYDILNAGPRRRFTVNGQVVSNCAYGATPGLIERRYKEITGQSPEEGMGTKVLEAWGRKNAKAWAYLENQPELVLRDGYVTGIAGLVRHFKMYDTYEGLSDKQRQGMLSGVFRESRNFPMQNAVAEATARAHLWLQKSYRKLNLKAQNIMLLYDALATTCPVKERWVVRRLHQIYLSEKNVWDIDGRKLQFGVETDFAYRLGYKLSREAYHHLYNPASGDLNEDLVQQLFA